MEIAPDVPLIDPDPEKSLYRETLFERATRLSDDDEQFSCPYRALAIIASLRQRLAIHDRQGDSELFALACELEFWLEVTF